MIDSKVMEAEKGKCSSKPVEKQVLFMGLTMVFCYDIIIINNKNGDPEDSVEKEKENEKGKSLFGLAFDGGFACQQLTARCFCGFCGGNRDDR